MTPATASGPQTPAGREKRQAGASSQTAAKPSSSCSRAAATPADSQASQGVTKLLGRPRRTKSPCAGIFP